MGRPRKGRNDLPKRVYFNHGAYYFVDANGKWVRLGKTMSEALIEWAKLLSDERVTVITVEQLLTRYVAEVLPSKAPRTQADNLQEISWLLPTFGAMTLDAVKTTHIASYRDARKGKTRANREIALLSHAFNRAIEWGLAATNPCEHVARNKEKPRDRYIEDEELEVFKKLCPDWLKAYIDLKCLIALRQQDMLSLRWADFETDRIDSFIKKVSKDIRIAKTDEVVDVISRLPRNGEYLFPLTTGGLRDKNAFQSVWGRVMREFVKAGGTRFTEHDIRGKVATDIDDPYQAQKLLAHSSIKMTEQYIKQRKKTVVQPHSRKKQNG